MDYAQQNLEALQLAQSCYMALERFRTDRERNKRYTYGDQWGDMIEHNGIRMTEKEYIKQTGSVPLTNNLIRRLVRNVIGVYTSQSPKPRCMATDKELKKEAVKLSRLLSANAELNRSEAMYVRTLEEFLIGGLVIHKKWYGSRQGRIDCWTDYVHPHNFFIDANMRDFRAWDCQCIGQVHDVSFPTLCSQFAHSAHDCQRLAAIYGDKGTGGMPGWEEFGYTGGQSSSFFTSRNPNLCRVIELWRRELTVSYRWHDPKSGRIVRASEEDYRVFSAANSAVNAEWRMEEKWRYYFLSPHGHVLASGYSPYQHGEHPYVVKAYPLIDGEIHSFVNDVIDQQRYTNRLITTYDWTLRSSAKGVLLVPEDSIPRGVNAREFAEAWSQFNGVMLYRPSARGDAPRQISSNTSNQGITDLLNLQLKFFEEISGVNGALEGRLANAVMSGNLYKQQTDNATMALQDLLSTFREFMRDCAAKDLSLIQQYHTGLSERARQPQFNISVK